MAATVYASLNCDFVEVALDFQMLLQNGLLMPVYCQLFIPLETQCHSVSVCSQCATYILNIQLAHKKTHCLICAPGRYLNGYQGIC